VVIDPVAIASTGTALSQSDAAEALRTLIQGARHPTSPPNRAEAEHFLGEPIAPDQGAEATAELARCLDAPFCSRADTLPVQNRSIGWPMGSA